MSFVGWASAHRRCDIGGSWWVEAHPTSRPTSRPAPAEGVGGVSECEACPQGTALRGRRRRYRKPLAAHLLISFSASSLI
ncbi:hypothetical protein, partial [Neisseria lactamica]|uniref:hypothetical protein n=1 Tax=Neisseria lactamica TaxID=486 RepID=UPI0027DF747F